MSHYSKGIIGVSVIGILVVAVVGLLLRKPVLECKEELNTIAIETLKCRLALAGTMTPLSSKNPGWLFVCQEWGPAKQVVIAPSDESVGIDKLIQGGGKHAGQCVNEGIKYEILIRSEERVHKL